MKHATAIRDSHGIIETNSLLELTHTAFNPGKGRSASAHSVLMWLTAFPLPLMLLVAMPSTWIHSWHRKGFAPCRDNIRGGG